MKSNLSTWNGYAVHGDINELDIIAESDGYVNLEKEDIVGVLAAEGENYVISGAGASLDDAFSDALRNLPCAIDKVNSLLIDCRCGISKPVKSNLLAVVAAITKTNPAIEMVWGVAPDESLGASYKVVLVASVSI